MRGKYFCEWGIFVFNLEVKMCFNSFVRCFIYVEVVVEV